jgi:hypothetical protein
MECSEATNLNDRNWRKGLSGCQGLPRNAKDRIVYEHLQNNGFQHIAEIFKEEAELDNFETSAFQQEYAELKDLILKNMIAGKFDIVREILKSQFPDFFKKYSNIKIELQILEFVQMVKKMQTEEAMQLAKRKLIKYLEEDCIIKPKLKDRIKKVLTLLAFRDLAKFPDQSLINSANIFRISHKVNNKISSKQKVESNLEKRQKFIAHFQEWLATEKSSVPMVAQFAPLKLVLPKTEESTNSRQGVRTVILTANTGNVYVD